MDPLHIITKLYDSEINAGLQTDWDGGITIWIGGPDGTPGNQRHAERTFSRAEFNQVGAWLHAQALQLFPTSAYARRGWGTSQSAAR